MGTNTRPELSDKNKWWISKHRYYELKHFCMQYQDWVKRIKEIDGLPSSSVYAYFCVDKGQVSDPTSYYAEVLKALNDKVGLVNDAAYAVCEHQFWFKFLVEAVTTGASYDQLEAQKGIMPVSRNEWYTVYRKFFWYLDKIRD